MPVKTGDAEAALRLWQDFKAGFRLSKKQNWWREYRGRTLTVHRRGRDRWSWCIAGAYGPTYSHVQWEGDGGRLLAMRALFDVVREDVP
jgi:hypothetical protein